MAAILLLMAATATTSAKDPKDAVESSVTWSIGGQASSGDATAAAIQWGSCTGRVTIRKVDNRTASYGAEQTCTGTILVQQAIVWIERCNNYGCTNTSIYHTSGPCVRSGSGFLVCPYVGATLVQPGPGYYRACNQTTVQSYTGQQYTFPTGCTGPIFLSQ